MKKLLLIDDSKTQLLSLKIFFSRHDLEVNTAENGIDGFDLLLANPPYIKSDEIAALQREVHFEPETALDGGKDGLIFYRRIAQLLCETECECVAVECGEEQAEDIKKIFSGMEITKSVKDFNGFERIVIAQNK